MKSYLLPVEDLVVVYANDEEFLKGKFVYTQREVLGIDIGLCYLNELVDDNGEKKTVDYVPLLCLMIKNLQARVEELEKKLL